VSGITTDEIWPTAVTSSLAVSNVPRPVPGLVPSSPLRPAPLLAIIVKSPNVSDMASSQLQSKLIVSQSTSSSSDDEVSSLTTGQTTGVAG
jgi:hypothetical protein